MVKSEKKKMRIKYIYIGFLIVFFAALIVLSLFGDKVYYSLHDEVESYNVGGLFHFDDREYFMLPPSTVVYEGDHAFVFVITSSEGFSMKLYNLDKREVTLSPPPNEYLSDTQAYITSGLRTSEKIVRNADSKYTDGQRVVIKKSS